jgi:hypothetical protein
LISITHTDRSSRGHPCRRFSLPLWTRSPIPTSATWEEIGARHFALSRERLGSHALRSAALADALAVCRLAAGSLRRLQDDAVDMTRQALLGLAGEVEKSQTWRWR